MMILTSPSRRAESRLTSVSSDHWHVAGHQDGVPFGEDGQGREYMGPGARERALSAAIHLAYGESIPELGALGAGLQATRFRQGIDGAVYHYELCGGAWEVSRWGRIGTPATSLYPSDEDGEPGVWESLADAMAAVALHAEFVRGGMDPVFAVLEVQRAMREARAA